MNSVGVLRQQDTCSGSMSKLGAWSSLSCNRRIETAAGSPVFQARCNVWIDAAQVVDWGRGLLGGACHGRKQPCQTCISTTIGFSLASK